MTDFLLVNWFDGKRNKAVCHLDLRMETTFQRTAQVKESAIAYWNFYLSS